MRISKSTKTDVKASSEPNAPDKDKSALAQEIIKQAEEIRDYFKWHNNNLNRRQDQLLEDLSDGIDSQSIMAIREAISGLKNNSKNMRQEQFYLIENLYGEFNYAGGKFEGMGRPWEDDVDACGDITASRTTKEKFLGTALLENSDDGKIHLNNFPIAPNDRCRYMWKNTMFPTTWNTIDEAIDAIESTLGVRVDRDKLAEMTEPTDHTVLLYLYGTNKAIMSTTTVSANDKALQHIKAAIDILGKSGKKDEVTKDIIANLAVVAFDMKSQDK